jgi:hypothetical protein
MADKSSNNFWGGFLLGAIIGGSTAAIVTAIVIKNQQQNLDASADDFDPADLSSESNSAADIEPDSDHIRQNLEQKIVQLNQVIDSVSQELRSSSKSGNTNTLE